MFLSKFYHGGEWPPDPGRLFQAIVAGTAYGQGPEWVEAARPALEWLERQPPPVIVSGDAEVTTGYKAHWPLVNSTHPDVILHLRGGLPLDIALREAGKYTGVPIRPWIFTGDGESSVCYVWKVRDGDEGLAVGVCGLARRMSALGWSEDVVVGYGELVPEGTPLPPGMRYVPMAGTGWRTPVEGTFDDLERAHKAFLGRMRGAHGIDTHTKSHKFARVLYARHGLLKRKTISYRIVNEDGSLRCVRWSDGTTVAAWLRHAAKVKFEREEWPENRIREYVCGHCEGAARNHRLAYVPLPTVGHEHADGRHRRAMIVLPPGDDGRAEDTAEILEFMGRGGSMLVSEDGEYQGTLREVSSADTGVLNRYVPPRPTREWASVTPVILPGFVTARRGLLDRDKVEKLFRKVLETSGYGSDAVEGVDYFKGPYWTGTGAAQQMRVPQHLERWPRFHARIVFRVPVDGPILVGIGRHYGIGIFAAVNNR